MAAVNVTVQVEPFESGNVAYAVLAPLTAKAKARGRGVLRLEVKNNEPSAVTVSSVTVSFPGISLPAETKSVAMTVGSGKTARWWFQQPEDDVMFNLPGPGMVKLAFACQGFADKSEFSFGLAPHVSPVAGGTYLVPMMRAAALSTRRRTCQSAGVESRVARLAEPDERSRRIRSAEFAGSLVPGQGSLLPSCDPDAAVTHTMSRAVRVIRTAPGIHDNQRHATHARSAAALTVKAE